MYARCIEAFAWCARLLPLLGIVVSGGLEPSVAQNDKPTDGKKNVLILYGERLDLPAIRAAEQSLRETFAASTTPQVEWFAEYFDFARFPTAEHEANLTRYLRERYAGRKIDLIMPVSSLSLRFLLRHREEIFPGRAGGVWGAERGGSGCRGAAAGRDRRGGGDGCARDGGLGPAASTRGP